MDNPSATSIVTVMRWLGQTVIDALVAASLDRVTSEPVIYHGPEPDDCCPEPGGAPRVIVWWTGMGDNALAAGAQGREGCGPLGTPVGFGIRLVCCWPSTDNGIVTDASVFAQTTEYLARAGWAGQMALQTALGTCDTGKGARNDLVQRSLGLRNVRLGQATPKMPRGGCAGIDWRVTATPTGGLPVTWTLPG